MCGWRYIASYKLFLFFVLIHFSSLLTAQKLDYIVVDSISVTGNKKTKSRIILRELKFHLGDTIPLNDLSVVMEESELLILNTGLFNFVKIYYKNWEGTTNNIHVAIEVIETWFLFPFPIFELADRDFNVWWQQQGRAFNRLNVGLEFAHLNFTGNNDRLKMGVKFGYTQSFSASYKLPFINQNQTLGLNTSFSYRRNRELNYLSVGNEQAFYRDDDKFVFEKYNANLAFVYRPKLRVFHEFSVGFTHDRIASIISEELNPDFFANQDNQQNFFQLGYKLTVDFRDIRPYPWRGYLLTVDVQKDGARVFNDRNALTFTLGLNKYLPFSKRFGLGLESKGKLSIIRELQSYQYNRGLGFGGDNLRGYELKIVDGLDMAYLRSSLRYNIFQTAIQFGKLVPIKAFRLMPIKMYFSLNNDIGYVNAPFSGSLNPLSNRILWGRGVGLDFVFFYDKVLKMHYSFNDLNESGFFLDFDLNF